jgi:hypothetical protein
MTHCLSSIVFVISLQFDSMKAPHLLGVFLTFVFGPVCCWLHSAITWKTYKEERKKEFLITFLCQITMSFISSSLLLICILFISVFYTIVLFFIKQMSFPPCFITNTEFSLPWETQFSLLFNQ